jgi:RNA recognition motif-containing protein
MLTALQTQHSRQRENLINSLLNKRHLQRKTEEAKEREAKRKEMQEQLQEVRGDIDHIQQQLEQKKEEEKRILIDSQKTTLTVENLPQDTSEELLEQIFQKYQGLKSVFVNQAK